MIFTPIMMVIVLKLMLKAVKTSKINRSKSVEIFDKNGQSLGIFSSCSELERLSEELFGTKLLSSNISCTIKGYYKQYKGFTFKYI